MVNLEALHVMVQNLQNIVTEIKDDGKKTLAQAQATNGRVNGHDYAIKSLAEDVESLKKTRSSLFDWILRLLMAAFGAQTIFGQLAEVVKHLMQ